METYRPRPALRAGTLTYLFMSLKPLCSAGKNCRIHSGYASPSPHAVGPATEAPAAARPLPGTFFEVVIPASSVLAVDATQG